MNRTKLVVVVILLVFTVSSCGMMAKMMGMGDLMNAMNNMDEVMAMSPDEMRNHASEKELAALERGRVLFSDPSLGGSKDELSCNSCHPGGGTTGGEAQIKMREYKMPIPSLVGASGTFPKYKVPNDDVITLQQMNNNCNIMFMSGKGINPNTTDAWSLETYVVSLSNGEPIEVGGSMMNSEN